MMKFCMQRLLNLRVSFLFYNLVRYNFLHDIYMLYVDFYKLRVILSSHSRTRPPTEIMDFVVLFSPMLPGQFESFNCASYQKPLGHGLSRSLNKCE